MSSSVGEISNNAANAATIAMGAVDMAAGTNASVAQLQKLSEQIGSVIGLIDGIAKQTNLLALNATIEAARAGDSGKGFAVVAHEVKELAQQTGNATGDVGRSVDGIRAEMVSVVDAIGKISEVIERINATQTAIAGAVEEQTATTSEMSRSIAEVAAGSTVIVDSMVAFSEQAKRTSAGATQTEESAREFARVASELRQVIARFQVSAG
jgi:methyl-accepting chemotaxis protein